MTHDESSLTDDLDALLERADVTPPRRARRAEITLHQLRIFRAVAHYETLTRAAKHLGLAQPSLSQQLAKLESTVGARLFRRHASEMALTEAGIFLLPKAEQILRGMQDLEDGLTRFSGGQRVTLRLAGVNSVLRVVLPTAVTAVQAKFPEADFDIQESAPGDILEMLYSRRVNIGLLAANSVAEAGVGFMQVPVIEDPYVLVVPEGLDLDGVRCIDELRPDEAAVLSRSIQFIFGTQHAKRVADWYDHMLPEHRVVAQCRSFEVALGLVRAGSGICLAPALSTISGGSSLDGVRLYRINAESRRIVALVASQYRRQEPYQSLIEALQTAGSQLVLPTIRATPPFLDRPSLSDF
ncbi:LysR family transcriptional regulator [Devosia sp. CN2-171]|uniref:LysR family transcriptional regulator n=1 Tax=Devosia sp. CN2-171 TaxID=3400909 RepID=UPI003BF91BCC